MAFADLSIVTLYSVANGRGLSGVKISVVVPDHRNFPGTAGAILKNGATTGSGILPRTTIGSLNTTRTSLASARLATSPTGPALTTRKPFAANVDTDTNRVKSAAAILFMRRAV